MVHFKGKVSIIHFCLQVFGISHLLNINNHGKKYLRTHDFLTCFVPLAITLSLWMCLVAVIVLQTILKARSELLTPGFLGDNYSMKNN